MKAIFPGSFNPFTRGHQSIADRSLKLFDELLIAVGYNEQKPGSAAAVQERVEAIRRLYAGNPAVEVASYSVLTADFAREQGAEVIVRGVRDTSDFEYERNMADVNRMISGVETIILPSLAELAAVSSSTVRELQHFGCDVSRFMPESPKDSPKNQ